MLITLFFLKNANSTVRDKEISL